MFILTVGWSKRMNSLSKIALVLYCVVLTIIPLTNLHVEDIHPDTYLLMSQLHQETDLVVLIHEVLFAHLRNIAEHFNRLPDRAFNLIEQESERRFPHYMTLKLCLLSLGIMAYMSYGARRDSLNWGKTLPQTIFCYRLFGHSPPPLYSQY